ncbi:MAG: hypothetical protein ACRCST_16165, partial [Turicibacter sp.]
MYSDDNIFDLSCQLEETRKMRVKGKKVEVNPWQLKKANNELLADSYKRLKMYSKSSRARL